MTACSARHSRTLDWRVWLVGLCAAASPALAAPGFKVGAGSALSFVAKITASSFEAKSDALSGLVDYDPASGKLKNASILLKAESLDTGLALRNTHMKDKYLEVRKFPDITLELKPMELSPSAAAKGAELSGTLTIKGITRPIQVTATTAQSDGGKLTATSSFPLDITQFGIAQPKYAVVKMDPVIQVNVKLVLVPNS